MTLTISAKDFGPIIEGTVELKPLTVFVGPSNTGKSYRATLVYAMMRLHRGEAEYGRYVFPSPEADVELSPTVKDAIGRWVTRLSTQSPLPFNIYLPFDKAPVEVQNLAGSIIEGGLQSATAWLSNELQRCYGEISTLRRDGDYQPHIALSKNRLSVGLPLGGEQLSTHVGSSRKEFDLAASEIQVDSDLIRELRRVRSGRLRASRRLEAEYNYFSFALARDSWHHLFAGFPERSYYLPAARSGIVQGHRVISSILIRRSSFAGLEQMEIPALPGIITDFIGHMLLMMEGGKDDHTPGLQESIAFLEREVVRGKVDFKELGHLTYPEISYEPFAGQPYTGKFFLRQTSSMVSELAPVILFLKYLVRPGDLLILEEPEAHLHPASQRRMAQGIVRLVNAGVRVLITTHSDYFLNQVNNLMRIDHASDRWLEQAGFERADCLKHADVGAYVFHWDDAAGGSRVEQLAIRRDVGIDDQEFGKVVNEQYEETIMVEGVPLK